MSLRLTRFRCLCTGLFFTLLPLLLPGQAGQVMVLAVKPYDHHFEISWEQPVDPSINRVRVYGSTDGQNFRLVGTANNVETRMMDYVGDFDVTGYYFLRAVSTRGDQGAPSDTLSATTYAMSDSALLDMVQEYTLRYFYDYGHPNSGLARERNAGDVVTTGGTGFGLMALIVGAERGFLTYEQALDRTVKIVDFLSRVDRFKGAFAHWYDGRTGAVIPFSQPDDGGDLVETAFLMQGLLTSRQYFSGEGETETALRDQINTLWSDVDWNWYRQGQDVLYWHWSENYGFQINLPLRGFNETHIAYLLGVASPTESHRIPASLYQTGWAGGNYVTNNVYYGIPLLVGEFKGGPLFFTHYSYQGFDPRGLRDQYTNYFVRNTNQTLINYEHAVENPYNRAGYGPDSWGITASDDPDGYLAHAPDNATLDNGTLTPTAALSSMPYTPEKSLAALKHFYRDLGERLWGPYGFYDAFNMDRNWYATSYLAIDQGPIVNMIENYRSGLLWDLFMSSPEIAPALEAVGFEADNTTSLSQPVPDFFTERPTVFPNPAQDAVTLDLSLARAQSLTVDLVDAGGRTVARLVDGRPVGSGPARIPLQLRPVAKNGLYFLKISSPTGGYVLPLLLLP